MPPALRASKRLKRSSKKPTRRRVVHSFGSAAELRALMEAAVDAIIVIDDSGRIVSFSPAAERMFGYEAAEVIGSPLHMLMPEPYRSEHESYVSRYQSTRDPRIIGVGREVSALRNSGEVFPVWLSVGEARSGGRQRFVGFIRDLTEQHNAERERRALEARLEHVGRLSLLGEMAAGIAHEINQPLSAITNYSQAAKHMLSHKPLEADSLKTACSGIAEQVQRAGEVIENLRSFVRKREIETQELDLNDMIRGALTLVAVDTSNAGVELETEFAEGLSRVRGNVVQLQQVLLNLTRNSVDAMKSGRSRVKLLRIVTRQADADTVEFEVSDRGPGISPNLIEAVFHPFFTTKSEGLGVGLAISRSIIEAHHGRLQYNDHPDGGAVFTVSLPVLSRESEE